MNNTEFFIALTAIIAFGGRMFFDLSRQRSSMTKEERAQALKTSAVIYIVTLLCAMTLLMSSCVVSFSASRERRERDSVSLMIDRVTDVELDRRSAREDSQSSALLPIEVDSLLVHKLDRYK